MDPPRAPLGNLPDYRSIKCLAPVVVSVPCFILLLFVGIIALFCGCRITSNQTICVGLTKTNVSKHVAQDIQCPGGEECPFQAGIETAEGCSYWLGTYAFNSSIPAGNITALSYITDWNNFPLGFPLWARFGCWPRLLPNDYDNGNITVGFTLFSVGIVGLVLVLCISFCLISRSKIFPSN
jgi:hypothetical protein